MYNPHNLRIVCCYYGFCWALSQSFTQTRLVIATSILTIVPSVQLNSVALIPTNRKMVSIRVRTYTRRIRMRKSP